jgi:hypothetical protein
MEYLVEWLDVDGNWKFCARYRGREDANVFADLTANKHRCQTRVREAS